MSLLSWARERFGWGYWGSGYGHGRPSYLGPDSHNWAGKPVTADGAMLLSAWFRGIKLYAEVTGAASLKLYERLDNDDRRQVRDHPIADLISVDPNIDQTPQEFWGSQAAGLAIFGNAYAEKLLNGIGDRIVGLQPLPYNTHPFRDENGDLFYRFNYGTSSKPETLPREKVFHTKGFSLGGDLGISPLEAARQGLSISLATEQAAGQTFSQGMRASGFFTGPRLSDPQRQDFTKKFIDPIIGNDSTAHYGILENGFDFKSINIPPKDAEMLLSRRFNLEELARFLGIPPILLGHSADGQTMWGTGVESIINQWLVLGLDAFWSNIEKSINKRLLSASDRRQFYAEFDRDTLLRMDSTARGAFITSMIQNGQMTPNEGRRKQNRPPLDGGDIALINSTLIPLTEAGIRANRYGLAPGTPVPPDPGVNEPATAPALPSPAPQPALPPPAKGLATP
jgi:HK97 family phage portal protein